MCEEPEGYRYMYISEIALRRITGIRLELLNSVKDLEKRKSAGRSYKLLGIVDRT